MNCFIAQIPIDSGIWSLVFNPVVSFEKREFFYIFLFLEKYLVLIYSKTQICNQSANKKYKNQSCELFHSPHQEKACARCLCHKGNCLLFTHRIECSFRGDGTFFIEILFVSLFLILSLEPKPTFLLPKKSMLRMTIGGRRLAPWKATLWDEMSGSQRMPQL